MRPDPRPGQRLGRGLLLSAISVLGLVTIVGSGGGIGIGFPPCTAPYCSDNPPPPQPSAEVQPDRLTVQVGSPATLRVATSNFTGTLSYQWHRSSDGGASFSAIPGATASSYTLAAANLGDDGAVFAVAVRSSDGSARTAAARLAVSSQPGVGFADGEFLSADWTASAVPNPPGIVPAHTEQRLATGGNPDAFLKMVYQVPQGAGSAQVVYLRPGAVYDPASQGAVYVIDYAEDCIMLQHSDLMSATSDLIVQQGPRRYASVRFGGACTATSWSASPSHGSLTPADFALIDGPACQVGESCPDFSAQAAPMTFGFRRIAWGTGGDQIAHGIDNWRVTVWRR
jgi:hypothetical protein